MHRSKAKPNQNKPSLVQKRNTKKPRRQRQPVSLPPASKQVKALSLPPCESTAITSKTTTTTTTTILPAQFLPTTPSKKELSRLGGIKPVLQLLGSRKTSLSQTAALVLSNCTGEDRNICLALLALEEHVKEPSSATTTTTTPPTPASSSSSSCSSSSSTPTHVGLAPLIEHLTDADSTVALHVAKTLAHCTSACNNKEATLYLSDVLRRLGGLRLLIGSISPLSQHEKLTAAVLLSLGNLCCDDAILCNEMVTMGALESLLLLLRPGRPLLLRDRATSTLLNCVEGTEQQFQSAMEKELVSIGAVSALTRAVETLIDGRNIVATTTTAATTGSTTKSNALQESMRRATEPMICGLLDLLLKCCGQTTTKAGSNGCDELYDCGGIQLCMILLDDQRQSVQERACRLLGCACGSAGRNARDIKRAVWSTKNGALGQLITLVEHRRTGLAKSARQCLDGLRNRHALMVAPSLARRLSGPLKGGELKTSSNNQEGKEENKKMSDDEVLLPLIEQGIVPKFYRISTEQIDTDSIDTAPNMNVEEIPPESTTEKQNKNSATTNKKHNNKEKKKKDLLKKDKELRRKKDSKSRKGGKGGKDFKTSKTSKEPKESKEQKKKKRLLARKQTAQQFAADYLAWLEMAVSDGQQGGSATFRVLLRTLCMNGNEKLRGHVAIALVILCFKHSSLRKAFVQEGALDATLSMLRHSEGRYHALDFLTTLQPIVQERVDEITATKDATGAALTNPYAAAAAAGCDPPPAEILSERHINNPSSSDVTLAITQEGGTPKQTLWTFHTHTSVLMICSDYFRTLITNENNENNAQASKWEDKKYNITVRSFEGFEAIMRFVYTADERQLFKTVDVQDDCSIKVYTILEIMNQAHELGMSGVRRLCAKKIYTSVGLLSADSILSIFEAGTRCGEDRLSMYCFDWVLENWMSVTNGWSEGGGVDEEGEEEDNTSSNNNQLIGLVRKFLVEEIVE